MIELAMDFILSRSMLTPLGLAACALLLLFSLLWRRQESKRDRKGSVNLAEKGKLHFSLINAKTNSGNSCITTFQNATTQAARWIQA
jgi:hypothetical protein